MSDQQILERVPKQQTKLPEATRKVLFENDQVIVIETNYPVGGMAPMHVHRYPHILYVVEGGNLEVTSIDGKSVLTDASTGKVFWQEAQRHRVKNTGSTPMKIIEVEMKHANSMVKGERKPREINPDDLKWEVDTIDPSRMIALAYGNPTKPGPYTVRLRAKPGYNISLHEHFAEDELLTVISGSLYWSTGEEGSNAPEHKLNAGGVVLFPANTPHRIWTVEQAEIQMTGIGPREYSFINPPEET